MKDNKRARAMLKALRWHKERLEAEKIVREFLERKILNLHDEFKRKLSELKYGNSNKN